jgi:hypothetical protein
MYISAIYKIYLLTQNIHPTNSLHRSLTVEPKGLSSWHTAYTHPHTVIIIATLLLLLHRLPFCKLLHMYVPSRTNPSFTIYIARLLNSAWLRLLVASF